MEKVIRQIQHLRRASRSVPVSRALNRLFFGLRIVKGTAGYQFKLPRRNRAGRLALETVVEKPLDRSKRLSVVPMLIKQFGQAARIAVRNYKADDAFRSLAALRYFEKVKSRYLMTYDNSWNVRAMRPVSHADLDLILIRLKQTAFQRQSKSPSK